MGFSKQAENIASPSDGWAVTALPSFTPSFFSPLPQTCSFQDMGIFGQVCTEMQWRHWRELMYCPLLTPSLLSSSALQKTLPHHGETCWLHVAGHSHITQTYCSTLLQTIQRALFSNAQLNSLPHCRLTMVHQTDHVPKANALLLLQLQTQI